MVRGGLEKFQSPYGDFGFRNTGGSAEGVGVGVGFQSPYGDFGFRNSVPNPVVSVSRIVSVPLRGFWV